MNHSPRNVNTRNVLLALAALVLAGCCAVAARAEQLRVATYNIKFLQTLVEGFRYYRTRGRAGRAPSP